MMEKPEKRRGAFSLLRVFGAFCLSGMFFLGLGAVPWPAASSETSAGSSTETSAEKSGVSGPAAVPVTVIELFTSEGCSSCPPAEAEINRLADEEGTLALSYHVDYWDYIGWPDPFASPDNTKRQRQYARYLGERIIYTPQMVFQGDFHTPGTRPGQIEAGYKAAKKVPQIPVALKIGDDNRLHVTIGGGQANGGKNRAGDSTVLLVTYVREASSQVTRGENAGRFLTHRNVVRSLERIGHWDHRELHLQAALPANTGGAMDATDATDTTDATGCAVLVQERGGGRIIGAAALNLP